MKKIIDDKDQKILTLIPKLKDTFKTSEFIEAFKAAYPEDYEMLEERFIHDERQTRSLDWKKNTIPTPEKYLVKAIKDFAKGHPAILKRSAKGFKKPGKPETKPAKSKPSTTPAQSKPTRKPAKVKSDAKTAKPKPAPKPAKRKPDTTAGKPKPAPKPAKSKSDTKSSKPKPAASQPPKPKPTKKTEPKKTAKKQ